MSVDNSSIQNRPATVSAPVADVRRTFTHGAAAALGTRVFGAVAGVGVYVTFSRLLGPDDFGDYAFIMGFCAILAFVADLGFANASLRFLPEYRARDDWQLAAGFLRRSWAIVSGSSLVAGVVCGLAVYCASSRLRADVFIPLILAAALTCLLPHVNLHSSRLRALHRILSANVPAMVLRPLCLMSGLAACAWWFSDLNASAALGVQLAATVLVLAVVQSLSGRAIPDSARTDQPRYADRRWLPVAFLLLLVSGSTILVSRTDVIMLGVIRSTKDAGIYTIAAEIASMVAFTLQAINMAAAPMMANLHAQGERTDLERLVRWTSLAGLLGALVMVAFLLFLGSHVMAAFGDDFRSGHWALAGLAVGQATSASVGPVGLLLSMTGHERKVAIVLTVAALANVILNALLIPRYGMNGAAVATACTTAVWNLVLLAVAVKHLAIQPTPLLPPISIQGGNSSHNA